MSEPIPTQAVIVHEAQPVAQVAQQPSIGQMIQAVLQGGITSETASVVERLAPLLAQERDHNAKVAFNRAFFSLRKEMPIVYADRVVKTDSGAVAFQYCSPQEIKDALEPLMLRHGFVSTTSQAMDGDDKVTVTVCLLHEGGHERESSFTLRVGKENRLVGGPQVVAGASTAAERHCLIKLFGLRTRINADDDARNLGGPITAEQAADLNARVAATKSDEKAFLKFAGAPTYETIQSAKWNILDEFLSKKARLAAAAHITAAQAADLKARLAAVGGDAADFLAGAASFEAIPASRFAVMDAALKKMEGK